MAQDKALALVQVPFHGDVIDAGKDEDGTVWAAISRMCTTLGLESQAQTRKLREKPWAGVALIATPSNGGMQSAWCIPLRALPMWLATIEASRVKPELREKLELYQKEAAEVLARHFIDRKPPASAFDPAVSARLDKLEGMLVELHRGLTKTRHRSPSVKSGVLFPTELEHAPLVAALYDVIEALGGSATAQQIEDATTRKATSAAIALDQHLRQWVPAMARETWTMRLGRLFRRMATWEATRLGRVYKVDGSGQSVRWGVRFVQPVRKAG